MTEQVAAPVEQDGRHDFDYLIGHWKIHNRRLRERLKGSDSWEEFEGTCVFRTILNGMGNFDETTFEREEGQVKGAALRLFNPATRQWSIYWADSVRLTLDVPMIGGFKDGVGEFYSQEPFEGRFVFCRFIWSGITATSCRWEQALSEDGGKTWETNWIMEFTRVE